MKFTTLIVAYIFLFSADSHAARCKIDGVWYSYDSPECSPERPEQPKPLKTIEPEEAPWYAGWGPAKLKCSNYTSITFTV